MERVKQLLPAQSLKDDLLTQKAVELIKSTAKKPAKKTAKKAEKTEEKEEESK